jgi:SET family sugar efflux transporter-like MFS transporter
MSLVRVSFSVAWTVGPAIGAKMMEHFGFRGVFLGATGLYLIFLAGVLRFVPFEKRTPAMRSAVRQPVWQVLTRTDIGTCFLAFLLFCAAQTIHMMNLPLLVTNVLQGTARDLGIMFGIGPVVEIPLMLWFGHLAARGHQLRLIRIGAVVPVSYFLVLLLVRAPWQVYPLQILHGVIFAIMSNVAIVFFQDLVPGQPGLATTIFGNASSAGNIAGYFCFGAVLEALNSHGVVYVCAALSACTLVILLLYRHRASPGVAVAG